ncbi:SDR family oxidoreductase [Nafulsella turpanensis]|uniref:SDR family oxidoreductase n=1 Tax=Nafulsella turpanensis TaxID=1265690 RepID=UPI00034735CA|nr:SDR family oxidoreductase [Nafulsella turpanensis]
MGEQKNKQFPPQEQEAPGKQGKMNPDPIIIRDSYKGAEKLKGKVALITGGDSGIGQSVAAHYAREGADVAIIYLSEDEDAYKTKKLVEAEGQRCMLIKGNLEDEQFCQKAVEEVINEFGKLNILVNNAGEQHPAKEIEDIDTEMMRKTFETNIFGMFYLTKAASPHLKEGDAIINTTSVTAVKGNPTLLDYSSTKGAILSFTRALALNLGKKKIRVNGVAPGPIWTPLIPSTFPPEKVEKFGSSSLLERAGQPCEVAPSYVLLASEDGSYITGQVIHVNGGEWIG